MGDLIYKHNWAATPLGPLHAWPDNLKTLTGIMLNSPAPMYIYWGPELISLYNDAFLPILSNTDKHPRMLGKPAKEFWAEAWHLIAPALTKLMATGEPFKADDVFIPIVRNGVLSNAHWSYTYSPAFNNNGTADGILMTLTETTDLIQSRRQLEIQDRRFQNFIREAPVGIVILMGEHFTVEHVNQSYADLLERPTEELMHKPLFSIIPETAAAFEPLLRNVLRTGEPLHLYDTPYFLYTNGERKEGFLNVVYQPFREKDGSITGVIAICHDVTAQIAERKNLQESELFSQNVFHNSPVAKIVFTGAEMQIRSVNENMLRMLGRDDSIIGKAFMEAIPELRDTPLMDRLRHVLATGETFIQPEEKITLLKYGEPYTGYYNYIYKPLLNTAGERYGIMVTATDVTENVVTRKELEKSESMLRSIIAAAPAGIAVFRGRELVIENPNKTFIDILGKGPDVAGRTLGNVLPELEDQPFLGILDNVFVTGEMFQSYGSKVTLIKNGEPAESYYNITFTPLFNEQNEVYAILDISFEVTSQVLAQEKVRRSEEQVRSLLQSSPFPIGVYAGHELRIALANQKMLDTWGKGNDVIGKTYPEILPELRDSIILKQLHSVLDTGIPIHEKNQRVDIVMHGRPEAFYFNYSFTPVLDENGQVYAVMNTAADITDLVLAKQKIEENELLLQTRVEERTALLRKVNNDLTTTNKELEQFSYAASHDLQEPLRKVQIYSDMLLEHSTANLGARAEEHLHKIIASVERMRNIITDLLHYSKNTGEEEQYAPTDLNEIIKQTETDLELKILQKETKITRDPLPVIYAAPGQMSQLFLNLYTNSLKFSKPGKPLRIEIRSAMLTDEQKQVYDVQDPAADYTEIIFSDNGIGFEQQYADQIFSLFKRLHGRREYEGTGIGLALCKKVVQNHKGIIEATAVQGKGASFRIVLPVGKVKKG